MTIATQRILAGTFVAAAIAGGIIALDVGEVEAQNRVLPSVRPVDVAVGDTVFRPLADGGVKIFASGLITIDDEQLPKNYEFEGRTAAQRNALVTCSDFGQRVMLRGFGVGDAGL